MEGSESVSSFLKAWAWKREHLPEKYRFRKPYIHHLQLEDEDEQIRLTISQAAYQQEGFASTVWDSSIVMAKFFERWPNLIRGKKCLDLSAGCGLVGIVMSKFGGSVTATDTGPNLDLLKKNWIANGIDGCDVRSHLWGDSVGNLGGPFTVVVTCDVMYLPESVEPLVRTLERVSQSGTSVYVSHGRNCCAESAFLARCQASFSVTRVNQSELHDNYQSDDIAVFKLEKI